MSLAPLSHNLYFIKLQKKYLIPYSKMKQKDQKIARDAIQLAMKAGYQQALLDRKRQLEKMKLPDFQLDDEEEEEDDDDNQEETNNK